MPSLRAAEPPRLGRALAIVMALLWCCNYAQARYPDHAVKIIVPLAPGGGADTLARIIAAKLTDHFGQQFFVENRPGAGTIVGTSDVVRASADGYTLLMGQSSLAMSTSLHQSMPFDVTRDLTPIIDIAIGPNALMVHPSVPAKTVQEFIAFAKASPGGVTFSSSGIGTPADMAALLFKTLTNINAVIVPSRGMNPAIMDLVGGNVQALFAGLPAAISEERDGKVRLVAVAEKKRSLLSPNTPTVAEAGFPEFDIGNWTGLLGPAALDPQIVSQLHDAISRMLSADEIKEQFAVLGFEPIGGTSAEFGRILQSDVVRWTDIVKRAHIPLY
jgi:tripartite-type tricarboxylate transporter receptor subunit TctC